MVVARLFDDVGMPGRGSLGLAVVLVVTATVWGCPVARADEPPTTVAGLLARYLELSREAERASERSTALAERADAITRTTDLMDRLSADLSGRVEQAAATTVGSRVVRNLAHALRSTASQMGVEAERLRNEQKASTTDLGLRITEVKKAVSALTPVQRALLTADASLGPPPAQPAAGAHTAVGFALRQLGKPYEWGAEGPDSFDCSGLVQTAYASVGIRLPRVAIDQSAVGAVVARADVRAGDLVFYYRPVQHVAIALDRDRVVHAATFGEPVKISLLDRAGPVTVIRRVQ